MRAARGERFVCIEGNYRLLVSSQLSRVLTVNYTRVLARLFVGDWGRGFWRVPRINLVPPHRHGGHARIENLAAAHSDQLRKNGDGDFLGRDRTDVEANRRMYALQALGRHALGEQGVVNSLHFRLAADQAEVPKVARGERAQGVEVVRVAACHDDDIRIGRNGRGVQPLGNGIDDHFGGVAKALAAGELLTVVEHVKAEAQRLRQLGEVIAYM